MSENVGPENDGSYSSITLVLFCVRYCYRTRSTIQFPVVRFTVPSIRVRLGPSVFCAEFSAPRVSLPTRYSGVIALQTVVQAAAPTNF